MSQIKELQKLLHNIQLTLNTSQEIVKALELFDKDRFLILIGESDDRLRLLGVVNDEVGAYRGADYTKKESLLKWDALDILKEHKVKVKWCEEPAFGDKQYSWTIYSDSPNELCHFDIIEDDLLFCKGLIIDLKAPRASSKDNGREGLETLINKYRTAYYEGNPLIEDEVYDALELELRELKSDSPLLKEVGFKQKNKANKVKHDSKMLSLAKVYTKAELEAWAKDQETISISKIDGSSCSLIYRDGELVQAKTRGDGEYGEDITESVRYLSSVPKMLDSKISIEVRGELYCKKDDFKELSESMSDLGLDRPSSERNIVAGLIGRKTNTELCSFLSFYAYGLLDEANIRENESDDLNYLINLGFKVPDFKIHPNIESAKKEIEVFDKSRDNLNFLVDGLVFALNNKQTQNEMGFTSHHPKFKMAFKFKSEEKSTVIQEIKWQVSRNGILTPVAVVEPVFLSGAMIENVTLHNFGVVRDFKLSKGTTILITRSGEVIPKFLKVVSNEDDAHDQVSNCPSCESDIAIEAGADGEEGIRLLCLNTECPAKVKEDILNYISVIGMENISDKRLEEMILKLGVKDASDLYNIKKEDFFKLDKVKEKLAESMFRTIQMSKSPKLSSFIVALGLNGGGNGKTAKIIESGVSTIEEFMSLSVEDLLKVESFAEKSANTLIEGRDAKRGLISKLISVGVVPQEAQKRVVTESFLTGKKVCITGKLSAPRKEFEEKIKGLGGVIVGSVSKNTDYLVCDEESSSSSKFLKAQELGVKILKESDI